MVLKLSSSAGNHRIKQRINAYMDWNSCGQRYDEYIVYKTFQDKAAADRYTNSVRHILSSSAFWNRFETCTLTKDDMTILNSYGIFIRDYKPTIAADGSRIYSASGSGFVISTNGLVVTNYHVVDKANGIDVLVNRNGGVKTYKAKVLISDKTNDISIIKIEDSSFVNFPTLPYAVKIPILDVGTSVFALGYPMSNILGEEIKVTDGIISSKTGYQGDIVTYQISAPIQPGNSGGPLFDKQGNLVGITNAGVPDAQNVGYAIKASYLRNLVDAAPTTITLPATNSISGLSFTEKIKRLTPYVVLIKIY